MVYNLRSHQVLFKVNTMTASVLTHNGIITLENPQTGNHRTFKIRTVTKGKYAGQRKIYLLIGPDNQTDYKNIGFIKNDGTFYIWNEHRGTKYEKTVNCLLEIEKRGLIVHFETKCRRCNRTLSTPKSCLLGIGPECEKME